VQGGDDEWYLLPVVADNHEPGHVSYIANPVRLRLLEEGRLALAEVPKFE
jgi:hypothetical protein